MWTVRSGAGRGPRTSAAIRPLPSWKDDLTTAFERIGLARLSESVQVALVIGVILMFQMLAHTAAAIASVNILLGVAAIVHHQSPNFVNTTLRNDSVSTGNAWDASR